MTPPALEARGLYRQVKQHSILHDVSMAVYPGERLGLIGPNGSGKSTLLRLLAGLTQPSQGEVTLEGQPLTSLPRRQIARRLAFVEQQAETADRMRLRDTVELGRTAWLSALSPWGPRDEHIVQKSLAAVSLSHLADRDWSTLSGGERQRAHIARALAQEPGILLLDEPGNHLDIHHQLAILALIKGLHVTTIMALHDLNQALDCDRLIVLHQGRMVANGPPHSVLTPEVLSNVFNVTARAVTDPHDGTTVLRFLL